VNKPKFAHLCYWQTDGNFQNGVEFHERESTGNSRLKSWLLQLQSAKAVGIPEKLLK